MKKIVVSLFFILVSIGAWAQGETITVRTAEEFLNAIGPDRTILIDAKAPLNLTTAINYLVSIGKVDKGATYYDPFNELGIPDVDPDDPGNRDFKSVGMEYMQQTPSDEKFKTKEDGVKLEYVTASDHFDGLCVQIRNCPNLTIRSKKGLATLIAMPRYVDVLEFVECHGLVLDHLVLGHTDEGYCDMGVLGLEGCQNVRINDCDLYGCGTEGFILEYCHNVIVNRSNIHDCTYHTMHVSKSDLIRFNDCKFYNNREFTQINTTAADGLMFVGCTFDNLKGHLFGMDDYCHFVQCVFRNCEMDVVKSNFEPQEFAILRHCTTIFGDTPIPDMKVMKPKFKLGRWTDGKQIYTASQMDDYSIILSAPDGTGFGIQCMHAVDNEYEMFNAPDLMNNIGIMGIEVAFNEEGQNFIRILDDGQELIKSLFYMEK